jgi:hypothetical protein
LLHDRVIAALLALAVAGCSHPAVAPAPVVAAPFVAESPDNSQTPPRDRCWLAGRFEGDALLMNGQLALAIPRAWVAVTRDNDKQWDDLHLAVEVSAHPFSDTRWPPKERSVPVVLRPTVDSAGPQLTTWQTSGDTLRLFVPWKQTIDPRWLVLVLDYRTLSHAGVPSNCSGRLGTDTLRFRTP